MSLKLYQINTTLNHPDCMAGFKKNDDEIFSFFILDIGKQRWTRGYKRYKETSGLIEWKECQIFHSIFT